MTAQHYTVGARFGSLVILSREPDLKVLCQCDCGKTKLVRGLALKHSYTRSCGCIRAKQLAERNRTHGQTDSRTYRIWCGVVTRCTNPARREFKWYGGAGIRVCKRWEKFENFLADMGEAPPGLSIDRRKGHLGYTPKNCYWATRKQQADNRLNTVRLTHNGETLLLTEWAARLDIPYGTLKSRIRLGWAVDRILTTPQRKTSVK